MERQQVAHRVDNRYRVRGLLLATSAIRVGSSLAMSGITGNPIARDASGRPYLPGSTLKGAFRGTVERVIPSLNVADLRSCGLSGANRVDCISVSGDRQAQFASLTGDERIVYLRDHLCTTCALFGSPVVAGRVRFADLTLPEGWTDRGEIRDGVAIDRDTDRAIERRRYDIEVLPAGTPFFCTLHAEGLTETDLGILAIGLLELAHGGMVLGGGKSHGFGRCQLEIEAIERVRFGVEHRAEFLAYLRDGSMAPTDSTPLAFLAERLDALLAA